MQAIWIFLLLFGAGSDDGGARERLRQDIAKLSSPEFKGRGGKVGRQLAREFIIAAWRKMGIQPYQAERYYHPVRDEQGNQIGLNLAGILIPEDPKAAAGEVVILSAHYDHLGKPGGKLHPGADDNASGVAALLEAGRQLTARRGELKRSVLFLAFDLEEKGLLGSRYYVKNPPAPLKNIAAFLTADMVGRALWNLKPELLFAMGAEHSPEILNFVKARKNQGEYTLAIIGADLIGARSDHYPFWQKSIPFLFLSSGEHPDYHKPTDTIEKIDLAKVEMAAEIMRDFGFHFATEAKRPTFLEEGTPPREEMETIHGIVGGLIQKPEAMGLGDMHVAMLKGFREMVEGMLQEEEIDPEVRKQFSSQVKMLMRQLRR